MFRIELGAIAVLVIALGAMTWMWRHADNRATRLDAAAEVAQQANAQLARQLQTAEQDKLRQEKEIVRLRGVVAASSAAASDLKGDLKELKDDDEKVKAWSDEPVPGAILERLRQYEGR